MPAYSGLWEGHYGVPYTALGVNTKEYNSTELRHFTKAMRSRGDSVMKAILKAMTGVAVGQTATSTHKQIAGVADPSTPMTVGGVRTINTVTDISRATVAADETLLEAAMDGTFAPTTYPTDRGGGGGGKLGTF